MTRIFDKRLHRNHLNLMAAILFRAVDDWFTLPDKLANAKAGSKSHSLSKSAIRKMLIDNAVWFNADDDRWTFSYVRVCKLLDTEPEGFYQKMIRMTPDEWRESKERIHAIYGPLVS